MNTQPSDSTLEPDGTIAFSSTAWEKTALSMYSLGNISTWEGKTIFFVSSRCKMATEAQYTNIYGLTLSLAYTQDDKNWSTLEASKNKEIVTSNSISVDD